MLSVATVSLLLSLIEDAPELISSVKQDIADFSASTISETELVARWTGATTAWKAAKAKWQAA